MWYKNILYATISKKVEIKVKIDFTNIPLLLEFPLQANDLTNLAGFFLVVTF